MSINNNRNNQRKRMTKYSFKPFVYEEVKPDKRQECNRVPLPRSGHRVVADNCNLYSFGGYNPLLVGGYGESDSDLDRNTNTYPLFQELWKFNFAARKWSRFCRQDSLPQELASNAVIRHGNLLMVYACVRDYSCSLKKC